jgi:hypothetical protein
MNTEELEQYRNTGVSVNQIYGMLDQLRYCCYVCKYGQPYYEEDEQTRKNKYKTNTRLTKCNIGKQGEDVLSSIRNRGCKYWELKEYE